MRKQLLLLKTLFVAVLLGAGTNAWATNVPYNVGTSTDATYLSAYSDVWEMSGDGILTVKFTNHCVTSNANHFNWHLICGNADDSPSVGDVNTNRYFVMRADRWDNVAGNADNFYNVSSNYFSDFMTSQDGATVTLKIVRVGTSIRVYTTAVKDATTYRMSYYYTLASSTATTKFYLTGSLSYMTITAVDQTDEVAGNVTTNVDIDFDNNCTATIQAANNTSTDNVITGVASEFRWKGVWNTLPAVSGGMLRVGNATSKVALTGDEAGSKDIVTISFDLGMVGLSGKELRYYVYDTDGTAIITENYKVFDQTVTTSTFGITDALLKSEYLLSRGVNNPGMSACKNTITITLNYDTQKMKLSINNTNTGSPFEHEINMPSGMKAVGSFAVSSNYGSGNDARRSYFDNLLITTTLGDYSTTKTITYAYQDQNENDITDLVVSKGGTASATPEKGSSYTPVYPASFVDDDYAYDYTYTSGGDAFTVTTDATITLVYTKSAHATTDVTVQYKYGNNVIEEEVVVEDYPVGKPLSYGVHQYVLGDDRVFYKTTASDPNYYRTNAAAATIAESLSLSDINNVVYFTEAEDVSGASTVTQTSRCSMGKLGYTGGSTTYKEVTTLAPGKYQIYWRAFNGNNSDRTGNFKVGESGDAMEYTQTKSTTSTGNTAEFTVLTSSKLYWGSAGSSNLGGTDWFYVVRTGDATVSRTITPAKYATYCSPYALDFSGVSGLKAYIAVKSDNDIVFTQVDDVPANTGVLLKGDAGNYAIPVIAESSTVVTSNEFVGVTEETANVAAGIYVLLDGASGVGFYRTTTLFTVGANTAYLPASVTNAARKFIAFDGGATAIKSVKSQQKGSDVYNLQGQRVKAAKRGLYIVNGKKVIK